jgi:cytochrome b6-f complex iron-sulfur subunit
LKNSLSRNEFLKILLWIFLFPFLIVAGWSVKRHRDISGQDFVRIPPEIETGVTFLDEIIIVKVKDITAFYSSRCPHLGCRINSVENNQIVCPCHGSKFSFDGRNLKGPANSSLKELKYSVDEISGEILIKI